MENMRLRFAPSPTGALHIGGVRTALYNYLLARKNGGTFILRIEDTDQTRYVEGAEQYIVEALQWLGITPDEGPGIGGDYGPYRQSERKAIYLKYTRQLIDSGHAYYAFDTAEELENAREKDPTFKYDAMVRTRMRNSISMSEEEVEAALENGVPHVVRLKVPDGETVLFEDLVRGEVAFDSSELDDKVLLKGDGMPTYHMANVVDDRLMEITHVVRGEEWLSSTAHHVLLYRSLGWEQEMPAFAHLPLILKPAPESYLDKTTTPEMANRMAAEFARKHPEHAGYKAEAFAMQILQDKKNIPANLKVKEKDPADKAAFKAFLKSALYGKLSKRDGDRLGFPVFPLSWKGQSEEDSFIGFREYGFLPEAVLNFLALLGWNPGDEQEMFSLEELVGAFSPERINKSGSRFNIDKAKWFNQQYIINAEDARLANLVRPQLEANGHKASDAFLKGFVALMKERAVTLPDFWENGYYFFERPRGYEEKMIQKRWTLERSEHFAELVRDMEALGDFSTDAIKATAERFMEKHGLKFGDVLPMLRLAQAGTMKGPAIFEMMELLGQEEAVARLKVGFDAFDKIVQS
ncbi:glutamate--tRNA ligase [Phaeodactylibacter sp.]|uniref:glutamate--tRNA ligase n=1 Tax=Phaeodactylibacter sp. TaxID=1940289 RepID=UPI0032EE3294